MCLATFVNAEAIQKQLRQFAADRDWERLHSPKNLASALSVEASELLEIFQWLNEAESRSVMDTSEAEHVREELADVLIYLLRLADVLEIDLDQAVAEKIEKNGDKHPASSNSLGWQSSRWDRSGAVATGFEGFVPFADLQTAHPPDQPGVYLILRPTGRQPSFLTTSQAGRHKGKDPTISIDKLQRRWVRDAEVVYVGKMGGGSSKATLRKRLRQYVRFGQGIPASHWGGRAIFQLSDWGHLLVAWRVDDEPVQLESSLLHQFKTDSGALPFANMRY